MKKTIKNFLGLTLGCVIYAFGFATLISPNDLAPGGVTGIAVLVHKVLPMVSTGVIVLAINIPLLIVGTVVFGSRFFAGTVYATVLSSGLMSLIEYLIAHGQTWLLLSNNLLLCALAGGAAVGLGMGIIFRSGGTTGGSDIVVKLLRLKFRHIKTGVLFIIIDATVVTASAFVFGNVDLALYAALSLIVNCVVLDIVLYGSDSARLVYIISDKNDVIAERLLDELDVGATYIKGIGAYSKESKTVLMVAVKKQIFPKLKSLVSEEDEKSFMIVSSANEIFGEGFKLHGSAEL